MAILQMIVVNGDTKINALLYQKTLYFWAHFVPCVSSKTTPSARFSRMVTWREPGQKFSLMRLSTKSLCTFRKRFKIDKKVYLELWLKRKWRAKSLTWLVSCLSRCFCMLAACLWINNLNDTGLRWFIN